MNNIHVNRGVGGTDDAYDFASKSLFGADFELLNL